MLSGPNARKQKLRTSVLSFGIGLLLLCWFMREPLSARIFEKGVLSNDAPPPDLVEEMIQKSANPPAAIVAAWNSRKIVHRQAAVNMLLRIVPVDQPLPPGLQEVLLSAALDPDMSVRTMALNTMRERRDPGLSALAAAQLRDADPEVRLMGLGHLKDASPAIGIPTIIPMLKDLNPMVSTMALKLLENWTGQDFGVNLSDALPSENKRTGQSEFREATRAKANEGVERATSWWRDHQTDYQPPLMSIPPGAFSARTAIPAGDLKLVAIDGKTISLADLRGKVVVLNFWTTWCSGCISELPELIALQRTHGSQFVVIGISLDLVPDTTSENPGERAYSKADAGRLREKVAHTVKAFGINYPVLVDEKNLAGGRYNGGELPTTLIIDANGWVRRRFIGTRSLEVFEAMIAEARPPLPAAEAYSSN